MNKLETTIISMAEQFCLEAESYEKDRKNPPPYLLESAKELGEDVDYYLRRMVTELGAKVFTLTGLIMVDSGLTSEATAKLEEIEKRIIELFRVSREQDESK